MSLTPAQIAEGKRMRAQTPPAPWAVITAQLKCGHFKIKAAIVPGYREEHAEGVWRRRNGLVVKRRPADTISRQEGNSPSIPHEVLADRDRRLALAPASLTAAICGDPAPGHSALDRKRA